MRINQQRVQVPFALIGLNSKKECVCVCYREGKINTPLCVTSVRQGK